MANLLKAQAIGRLTRDPHGGDDKDNGGFFFFVVTGYAALRALFGSVLTSNAAEGKDLRDIAAS
jgi:hypothetical protein